MSARGFFVVIEGCDGTGKTTQAKRIAQSGILGKCETKVFPDRTTPIGMLINQFLKKELDFPPQAVSLLYTANRWELAAHFEDLLSKGTSIVCDRYWYSGTAYSVANGGLTIEWCKAPEEGIPMPDLVIFIDVDPKILLERKGFGEERYEKLELQKKVNETFHKLKEQDKGRKWVVIDGSKPLDEVSRDIDKALAELVAERK